MRSNPVRRCTTKRRRTADPAPLKRGYFYAWKLVGQGKKASHHHARKGNEKGHCRNQWPERGLTVYTDYGYIGSDGIEYATLDEAIEAGAA